jgi:hypothetical protein
VQAHVRKAHVMPELKAGCEIEFRNLLSVQAHVRKAHVMPKLIAHRQGLLGDVLFAPTRLRLPA